MALRRGSRTARPEAGFALIEVVVSALIAVTVTGGVIKLLNVSGHAGSEQRHRSQAFSIAQEDQARMRGMQIPSLNNYSAPNQKVAIGGTNYTVNSSGKFVNDKTAELSCQEGAGSADYIRIRSEVTWPSLRAGGKAVVLESIVTPPSGSLDPTHGTLVVSTVNAKETPISSVLITGSGPTSLTGSTDSTGCVIFPDIPEGNYSVTPGFPSGYINKDGEAPKAETVGVVGDSTKTKTFTYDREGSLKVSFVARGYNGVLNTSKAASVTYINNQMQVQEKVYPTPSGLEENPVVVPKLFPFSLSEYTVFAGCDKNKPDPGEAMPSALVPSAGQASVTVRLPVLYVNVWTGRNSSNKGSAFANADVWVKDDKCNVTRRYTTNSSGQLADPGFPWSQYDICADTLTSSSGTGRRQRIENQSVTSLTTGTTLNFYLGSGTGTVSTEGNCP